MTSMDPSAAEKKAILERMRNRLVHDHRRNWWLTGMYFAITLISLLDWWAEDYSWGWLAYAALNAVFIAVFMVVRNKTLRRLLALDALISATDTLGRALPRLAWDHRAESVCISSLEQAEAAYYELTGEQLNLFPSEDSI